MSSHTSLFFKDLFFGITFVLMVYLTRLAMGFDAVKFIASIVVVSRVVSVSAMSCATPFVS